MRHERGVSAIIAYKLGKGGLWLIFAATLAVLTELGLGHALGGVAQQFRHHAAGHWSVVVAEVLVRASTERGLWTLVVALCADGGLSLTEGWALRRGRWWAPWLVVASSGSLLPFELAAGARHPSVLRFAIFAVNLAIVLYLAAKARRELRERRAASPSARPSRER